MPPEHAPLAVDKVTGRQLDMAIVPQERHIVAVRDEADVLTVGLVGVEQPRLAGAAADGGLIELAHR